MSYRQKIRYGITIILLTFFVTGCAETKQAENATEERTEEVTESVILEEFTKEDDAQEELEVTIISDNDVEDVQTEEDTADYEEICRINVSIDYWEERVLDGPPRSQELVVTYVADYPSGTLYEMRVEYEPDFAGRYYNPCEEIYPSDWDTLNLGCFLICEDQIYRIVKTKEEIDDDWTEERIKEEGTLVYNKEPVEDKLSEDEKGYHYFISWDDGYCVYHFYELFGDTNFGENFIWNSDKEFVGYYKARGALADYLGIARAGNEGLFEYWTFGKVKPMIEYLR